MYNRVILVGRLTRDPQMRYTGKGTPVSTFNLAVQRPRDPEQADFIKIVSFGKLAEIAKENLAKGRLILIEGHLQNRRWTDSFGNPRSVLEVIANSIKFLGRRKQEEGNLPLDDSKEPVPENDEPPF